jgi:hypothetical protein
MADTDGRVWLGNWIGRCASPEIFINCLANMCWVSEIDRRGATIRRRRPLLRILAAENAVEFCSLHNQAKDIEAPPTLAIGKPLIFTAAVWRMPLNRSFGAARRRNGSGTSVSRAIRWLGPAEEARQRRGKEAAARP